jgi:hypothetical protein
MASMIKGMLACVDDPSRVPETNILPDAKLNYLIPGYGVDVGLGSISAASSTRMFVAYLLKDVLIAIYVAN